MNSPKLAYICFDVVPSAKGAAIHIAAFAKTLTALGHLHLVTVSPNTERLVSDQLFPNVQSIAFPALGKTLIDRILYFRQQLTQWLYQQSFDAIQFRSIYEGFPIALRKSQICRSLIFEVNGLPSIELKYRYPQVIDDRELMQKLLAQEQICLDAADRVITPSATTANYLSQQRSVPSEKIRVIPNGVDLTTFNSVPLNSVSPQQDHFGPTAFRLLYFGTLAAWQGVAIALEAIALYQRDAPAKLTILGTARPGQVETLQKQAHRLGISDQVQILPPVSQAELVQFMHQADAIAAPLTANDRNLLQGCCPLKVLEGMASGTPVITSDLPVVYELGEHGTHFLAVKPGSAKAIKDAMVQLSLAPEMGKQIAIAARRRIEQFYSWEKAGAALLEVYGEMGACGAGVFNQSSLDRNRLSSP
jgi:glycosyltransferase involved in cell wall biosynthesis